MGEVRSTLASMNDVVHWRNNTGALKDATGRIVRYGLCEGSADLIACVPTALACPSCGWSLPPIGRFVGIEVKGPQTRTTPEQFAWMKIVRDAHGHAEIVREARDAVSAIQYARLRW